MIFQHADALQQNGIVQHGGTEKLEAVSSCVVYDPATGHIQHLHHCVTMAGGRHPSDDEIARDAVAAALRGSLHNRRELKVLHIPAAALEPGKSYFVDHERQALAIKNDGQY